MDTELREKLESATKQELVDYTLKLIKEKKELQDDLQTTGKSVVAILQNTGLMTKDLKVVKEMSVIAGSLSSLGASIIFNPKSIEKKFHYLSVLEPLLDKYEYLIKD